MNRTEVIAIEELNKLDRLEKMIRQSERVDFPEETFEAADDRLSYSVEDKQFIKNVTSSIKLREDHYYEIDSKVNLPDNSQQAINRLKCLEKRMKKNPKFHADYSKFMNSLLEGSYAERVPENELCKHDGEVWYIPHHGVYHPRKVDKLRVKSSSSHVTLLLVA